MDKIKNQRLIALLLIGVFIVFYTISSYNSFIRLSESVNNGWAQVENQLKRRADLIPNLINTVKGYTDHESEVLTQITKARSGLLAADTPKEYAEANEQVNQSIRNLNVAVEQYPELKANENFIALQDELAGTENRIATARKDYNEQVNRLNGKVRRFPTNILAKIFNFELKEYFEITEEEAQAPNVKF